MTKEQELKRLESIRASLLKDVGCSKVIIKELAEIDLKIEK